MKAFMWCSLIPGILTLDSIECLSKCVSDIYICIKELIFHVQHPFVVLCCLPVMKKYLVLKSSWLFVTEIITYTHSRLEEE